MLMPSYLQAFHHAFRAADRISPETQGHLSEIAPSERLAEYMALQGSTTFFLETISGMPVEVEVLHQSIETHPDDGDILRRHSRLYVRHVQNIILVAESTIRLALLDPAQRGKLLGRKEGIGKMLDPRNRGLLEKSDIEIICVDAPPSLETQSKWAIARYFALRFNGVQYGEIREILNNESLERAQ
jgi:chorismate-pyruvate lyase